MIMCAPMETPIHLPTGKVAIDRDRHVVSIHVTCESPAAALEFYRDLLVRARQDGGFTLDISLKRMETINV